MADASTTDAAEARNKVRALTSFMAEQTEREAVVLWLRRTGDSKPHGTDWRTYYAAADAIALGQHRDDTLATAEAASGAGEREEWQEKAEEIANACGMARHSFVSAVDRDNVLRDAASHLHFIASLPPATAPAMVTVPREEWDKAYRAFVGAFDTPLARRRHDDEYAADARRRLRHLDEALAAAPTIPATGEAIRAVTAEMRRFMPTACGDWADKIDDALAEEKGRKVAFYDEGGIDIRPGESLADRDRRIYQQGRHDALNDEPEAFI